MQKEVNKSPFSRESETHEKIFSHLKSNPRGLSTQEIEQQTNISRKAVEKHLQILLFENEIYVKQFGSTRVYYPNHRYHHLDYASFEFGKKKFYLDLIENNYGRSLLIQQKIKEKDKWIIKGSVFIPLEASKEFANKLKEVLNSKRLKEEIREVKKTIKIKEKDKNLGAGEELREKKEAFLKTIISKNHKSMNKYKRVADSPIRYAGGKSLAVGHVIELLPDNVKRVISPFFGGGSIEIAISKYLDLEVRGYEIFDILCNYWKFQIEKPKLLYEELKKLKPTKEEFERIRKILNKVWKKEITLDSLTLAVYFVYNFNLSYGPGFMGWSSDIYLNENKYKKIIEKIRDFVPKNLKVECADFQDTIKKYPNDFLYCDPPYYIGKDSKMFKGIYPMRNIPVHHKGFPHEVLRDLLKTHKGGFILSYNDCPTIRKYYKEFQQFFPSWQYTMGQGETRIGKNRIENGDNHIKGSHEILIFCPPKK